LECNAVREEKKKKKQQKEEEKKEKGEEKKKMEEERRRKKKKKKNKFHYHDRKRPSPFPILSQINQVQSRIILSYYLKINLNIFIPSTDKISEWSFLLRFSIKTLHAPLLSPMHDGTL